MIFENVNFLNKLALLILRNIIEILACVDLLFILLPTFLAIVQRYSSVFVSIKQIAFCEKMH